MFLFNEHEWVFRTRCSLSTNRSKYSGRDVPLQRTGVSIQDEMFLFNEQEWVMVAVFRLTLLWLQADGSGEEGAGVQADGVEARSGTSVGRRRGEGQPILHPSRGWQAAGQILRGGRTQGWAWNTHTVKSIHFVRIKICGLTTSDMFLDSWICGFLFICNIIKVNNYIFVGILNLWFALPTKYTKLNVQRKLMIS